MKIENKRVGSVEIIRPEGRLDAQSSEVLKELMGGLIERGNRRLIVNLELVEYTSSSGLRVMLVSMKQLRKIDGDLKLACLKPYVMETFEIAGFTQLFEIYEEEEDAIAEFGR